MQRAQLFPCHMPALLFSSLPLLADLTFLVQPPPLPAAAAAMEKPHAVCIPFPAQGHVTPMMQLAKLLHSKGFHISFVNTEFNHQRLVRSRGPGAFDGLKDFRFETIPDGLPPSHPDRTQDIPALCDSATKNFHVPFLHLLQKLNESGNPPVTCIISDGAMSFTHKAAQELGLPVVFFWTTSACGFWGYFHYLDLIERGYTPLKEESQLTNGYLRTRVDWIKGMQGILLRDMPSFIRTLDRDDIMLNYGNNEAQAVTKGVGLILNTFEDLEYEVLEAIRDRIPRVYTVGPLLKLGQSVPMNGLTAIKSSLWKEEDGCLEWLDEQGEGTVVYVNFGSITVMSPHQLVEFAWGLANSNYPFLWIIRPDLVQGEAALLPKEFLAETRKRGRLASWCPQQEVLSHPSVGVFLTHSGWNSTVESICGGVPMLCWPFFAEQTTNCRFTCTEWEMGMEMDSDVRRKEIEGQVREMMEGKKGKEKRRMAKKWKEAAEKAALPGGPASVNLERLIKDLLQ
ncbi:7-deoxyloganetin glucosyltransferase-like isoform X1 [Nymphaea colorata]|nr:7-deoxyloganetin glucosyltransferase-like isoform X1 [Nymphaea colorata]